MKKTGQLLIATVLLLMLGGCVGGAFVSPTPAATSTPAPSPTPVGYRDGWRPVWQDEFEGSELDMASWTHEIGGHGWGNAESQYYSDTSDNSFIEDGNLVIQVLEQNKRGKLFTSARLITKDKVEVQYGRIEARIKIPTGQGIWPAFWMLGNDIDEVSWPQCGEIDIVENIGSEPSIVHGTVHGPGYSGASGVGKPFSIGGTRRFAEEFHVFAVEWEPEEIRWYVDDNIYNTLTPANVPGEWVFDHPFYILLNVAVGGLWPGYPDDTTEFPQRMTVDYVRVYERP